MLVKLSLATAISLFPSIGYGQNLSCFNNLIFGQIVTCGSPGTVRVNPDGSQSSTCVSVSGPVSNGRCTVTQSFPFRPVQVKITAAAYNITNGTTNMAVTNIDIVTNNGGLTHTQTAPFVDVPIGATLNIAGSQSPGNYSGAMSVTAVLQ